MRAFLREQANWKLAKDEKAIEVAENLIEMNLTTEQIVQATGLSIHEVEKLKEKIAKST